MHHGTLSRCHSKRRKEPISSSSVPQSALLEDLTKLWVVKAVPLEQQSAFLAVVEGLSDERKRTAVAEELDRVKKGTSMAQVVDRAIASREGELRFVRELLLEMEKNTDSAPRSELEQLSSRLSHLRALTLEVVRAVQLWRERLFAVNPWNKRILKLPYIWEGGNYLLKLRSDLSFLKDSAAARHWDFSDRTDPFLQFPPHAHKQQKGKVLDLPIPPESARELKLCERILLDEVLSGRDSALNRGSESERQGLSNDGDSSDRACAQPTSEELMRPVTRGKEKQFARARQLRTGGGPRDQSV